MINPLKRVRAFADNDVHERLAEIKREFFSNLHEQKTYTAAADEIYGRMVVEFGEERVAKALVGPMLVRDIKRDVDKRCIEEASEFQTEMFGEGFLEATIKVDENSFTKMRLADASLVRFIDERKRINLERMQASYEKWCERRDVLLNDCGMAVDPTMTVEQAVLRYRRSSGPSSNDETRPTV